MGFFDPLLSFPKNTIFLSFTTPRYPFSFPILVLSKILPSGSFSLMSVTTIEGLVSNSENKMGLDDNVKSNEDDNNNINNTSRVEGSDNEEGGTLSRYMSESSVAATEEEEEDEDRKIELGPQCTLKEQLEKDKVWFDFFSFVFLVFLSFNFLKSE